MKKIYKDYIKNARKEGKSVTYIVNTLKGRVSEREIINFLRKRRK